MSQHTQNLSRGAFYAFLLTFVAAGTAAASKYVSSAVPVPVIVLIQYLICCIGMLPWLSRCSLNDLKTPRWPEHLIRGLTGWTCFYTYYQALEHIPLVDATMLRTSSPLYVPIILWLWTGIRIPAARWLPIAIGFIGIYIILEPSSDDIKWWHLLGLVSGITLAGSMVATRVLSKTEDTNLILFYYFFISLLCSIPTGLAEWRPIPLWAWPYLIGIGLSIFFAMWMYTLSLSYTRASIVAPIGYFAVVVSGILGWIIWGHAPALKMAGGILLVMTAGLLAIYLGAREEKLSAKRSG
jgi:drug/metabolite transporter (DMT)-like permease